MQRHTTQRVVVPAHIGAEELKKLLLFNRLLSGEQVTMSRDRPPLPARAREILLEGEREAHLRAAR
ncbi:hypothetical protein [Streptosporangium sp. NPDC003464]